MFSLSSEPSETEHSVFRFLAMLKDLRFVIKATVLCFRQPIYCFEAAFNVLACLYTLQARTWRIYWEKG